jgi:predicted alpha/beta superfamily hydrolase
MMNDRCLLLVVSMFVIILPASGAAPEPRSALQGEYLGQTPPGMTPTLFAPGVVSTEVSELNAAFSPDGNELYFTRRIDDRNTLMTMRRQDGVWTSPAVARFSGTFSDVDPFITRDGRRLYFSSNRPLDGTGEPKDSDLWYLEREIGGEWSEPVHPGNPNTAGKDDYYTSLTDDGTLYFSIFDSHGEGGDIYRAEPVDGGYGPAERVGDGISTGANEHDPFVAPDGRYLIFTSNRPGGYGSADLYISFAGPDGSWSEPINMGESINSKGYDFCAMLSPDGAGVAEAAAAPDVIVVGEKRTLRSGLLDEDRELWISRPEEYDASGDRYPVLYLLDGEVHFQHGVGVVRFLASIDRIPEMIVVGIANPSFNSRTRDLTPPPQSDKPTILPSTGGAEEFLRFLAVELIPFIDREYRTEPFRILAGHSLGGLFAVHTLMNRPETFRAYVPISPSLWWDESALVTAAGSFFARYPQLQGFLYITRGDERDDMRVAIRRFVTVLGEEAPDTFRWKFAPLDDEDHHSVPHRGLYGALEWLYSEWRLQDAGKLAGEGGIEAIDLHFARLSERFGYAVHPSEYLLRRAAGELLSDQRVDEAIVLLDRSAGRFPASAGILDALGDAYQAVGDLELARDSYRKAYTLARQSSDLLTSIYKAKLDRLTATLETP